MVGCTSWNIFLVYGEDVQSEPNCNYLEVIPVIGVFFDCFSGFKILYFTMLVIHHFSLLCSVDSASV